MSSFRSSSRYNSFDNRSSTQSDPSSSISRQSPAGHVSSQALVKSKSTTKNAHNLTAMVKKFMEKKTTTTKPKREFVVPADITAAASTRVAFGGLHKKLFPTKSKEKALTEVKPRTLAMVLRSERELLTQNKDQEAQITHLNVMLQQKNTEVDKLKDLCLKQREEINSLKSAILFPEEGNKQQQEDSEEAKQVIPSLQRQVTSLTGQLQSLAQDLAEVKAEKYVVGGCYDSVGSPRTPTTYDQEEATNSMELSSWDRTTTPGSPDDMFLNDLNPCLTPYAKSKSKEFECHSSSYNNTRRCHENGSGSYGRKLSKSCSDEQNVSCSNSGKNVGRRSDENKYALYGIGVKNMHH